MKHPCKYPGCPALLSHIGYCPAHIDKAPSPSREYDKRRRKDPLLAMAARIRSSQRWKNTRALKLSQDPLCEDPHGLHRNSTATATEAHHKQGLVDAPELAYVLDNLMSVCSRCHAILEAEVRKRSRTPGVNAN